MTAVVPPFWVLMCTKLLGTTEKFACRLWRCYDPSPTLTWQLHLCSNVPSNLDAWTARVRHLTGLMKPASLLEAAGRLSPENGRRREPEVIAFEARVLQQLDHEGRWRW